MVHKKYIKKGGKVFGPYYYNTKRVDGKVVTTYVGKAEEDKKNSNFDYFFLVSAFIITFLYFVYPVSFSESVFLSPFVQEKVDSYVESAKIVTDYSSDVGDVKVDIRKSMGGAVAGRETIVRLDVGFSIPELVGSLEIPVGAEVVSLDIVENILEEGKADEHAEEELEIDSPVESVEGKPAIAFSPGGLVINPDNLMKSESVEIGTRVSKIDLIYSVPAPEIREEVIDNGKRVRVLASDDYKYRNVLAFSDLTAFGIGSADEINIYWVEQNKEIPVEDFSDGVVYWIVEGLSEQTFVITTSVEVGDGVEEGSGAVLGTIVIGSCQPLNSPDTTYQFSGPIVTTDNVCFDVQASGISIDGADFTLTHTGGTGNIAIDNRALREPMLIENILDINGFDVSYAAYGGGCRGGDVDVTNSNVGVIDVHYSLVGCGGAPPGDGRVVLTDSTASAIYTWTNDVSKTGGNVTIVDDILELDGLEIDVSGISGAKPGILTLSYTDGGSDVGATYGTNLFLKIVNRNFGMIDWSQGEIIDSASLSDLSSGLVITDNFVSIDGLAHPELDRDAVIHLYNIPVFPDSVVLKNNQPCDPLECVAQTPLEGAEVIFSIQEAGDYRIGSSAAVLDIQVIEPIATEIDVPQGSSYDAILRATCSGQDCGSVEVGLLEGESIEPIVNGDFENGLTNWDTTESEFPPEVVQEGRGGGSALDITVDQDFIGVLSIVEQDFVENSDGDRINLYVKGTLDGGDGDKIIVYVKDSFDEWIWIGEFEDESHADWMLKSFPVTGVNPIKGVRLKGESPFSGEFSDLLIDDVCLADVGDNCILLLSNFNLVSEDSGVTPFYTTSTNPQVIINLLQDEIKDVTFSVVASGSVGESKNFGGYVGFADSGYKYAEADTWLATITEPGCSIRACDYVIDTPGEVCTVEDDLTSVSGNCITITADDVTLEGNWHLISGSGTAGVEITGANNVVVDNLVIDSLSEGVRLTNSFESKVSHINATTNGGISLSNSEGNLINSNYVHDNFIGLLVGTGSHNNVIMDHIGLGATFADVAVDSGAGNLTLIDSYFEKYNFVGIGANITFEETGEARIMFLEELIESGFNLSDDVRIDNSLVIVESVRSPGLNVDANITLFDIGGPFGSPAVLRNGENCPSDVCYVFGTLDGPEARFNVTGWTDYTVGERVPQSCPITLSTPGETFTMENPLTSEGTCFIVEANNVVIDGDEYTVTGDGTGYGVFAQGYNNLTLKNIRINNFGTGADISADGVLRNDGGNLTLLNSNVKSIRSNGMGFFRGPGRGGDGGKIMAIKSRIRGDLVTSGGGSAQERGGKGGDAIIENGTVDIRNLNINLASGGSGRVGAVIPKPGRLVINYSDKIRDSGTTYGPELFLSVINSSAGEINWMDNMKGLNTRLRNDVKISFNYTFARGIGLLDSRANISLYNNPGGAFTIPELKRDGSPCLTCHVFTPLTGDTVSFNVTDFSDYGINEREPAFEISLSPVISDGIVWTLLRPPKENEPADGNNDDTTGITGYYVDVSTNVDIELKINADGPLVCSEGVCAGEEILLEKETYNFDLSDSSVPGLDRTSLMLDPVLLTTLPPGEHRIFMKFYLNVDAGQKAGDYSNLVQFSAVPV